MGPHAVPGEPASALEARLGHPTAVYPLPEGQEWEYATGPFGQRTWMARIGADGRVRGFEQVLTSARFAAIEIDHARKADVLRIVGHPAETSRVMQHNYEVWSYRYKESDVWNSMMHVHFDQDGVVRMMLNGPDRMFDHERFR